MNKKLLISALLVFAGASQVFAGEEEPTTVGQNASTCNCEPADTPATSETAKASRCATLIASCKASCQNGYAYAANRAVSAKNSALTAAATTRKAVNFGKKQATFSNALTLWALDNKFDLVGKAQTAAHSVHSNLPARVQAVIALVANKASVVTTPIANAYNKATDVVNNALEVTAQSFGSNGTTLKSHASTAILAFQAGQQIKFVKK